MNAGTGHTYKQQYEEVSKQALISLTRSLPPSLARSLAHSLTHSLTHSHTHTVTAFKSAHNSFLLTQACQLSRVYRESHGFTTLLKGSRSNLTVFEKSRDLFFFFFFFFFWSQHSIYQFFFTTHCNTTIKVQKSQDFFTFQVGRPVNTLFQVCVYRAVLYRAILFLHP